MTGTPELTTKYLGLCLMSQAGVAVGLSLVVEQNFLSIGGEAATYGILILNVIALTTMILQVFGPVAASEGLRRAGEYPDDLCVDEDIITIESTSSHVNPNCENETTNESQPQNSTDELMDNE